MSSARCPYCEPNYTGYRTSAFNWKSATQTPDFPDLGRYVSALQKVEDLRIGTRWACKNCDYWFWLDEKEEMIRAVPDSNREFFRRWGHENLQLSPFLFERFKELAPIEDTRMGRIEAPAKVTFDDKSVSHLAVIQITTYPHVLFWDKTKLRLGSDIATIEQSSFALPYPVRVATHNATFIEVAPSCGEYSKTEIVSPLGQRFLVNANENLFMLESRSVRDLQLASGPSFWSRCSPPRLVEVPEHLVTWIVAESPPCST